ncbi:MAG: peptidyl-prolyl cis-trans isomerase [Clostridium sp.]
MVIQKQRLYKIIGIISLIVIFTFAIVIMYRSYNKEKVVATVNSENISVDEFKLIMNDNLTSVTSYFNSKYNVDSNEKDYWTTSFGGEIPLEVLKEKTLEQCIDSKLLQIVAKKKGVIEDISYSEFKKRLDEENKRRKESIENNKPIYGPVEYREREYFEYELTNITIKAKDYIMNNEISFDEDSINKYYDEIKDEYFKIEDTVKVQQIFIPFKDGDTNKYKDIYETVKRKLENNEDLKSFIDGGIIEQSEREFTPETASEDENKNSELRNKVYKLKENEVSDLIEVGNGYYIMKCISIKENGYQGIEDVESLVKTYYTSERYDEIIKEMKSNIDVKINKKEYKTIEIS